MDWREHARELTKRILSRLDNIFIAKGMLGWRTFMDLYRQKQEEQVKLARFAQKLKNREAVGAFEGWLSFMEWRNHTRDLTKRILKRLDNILLFQGMRGWQIFKDQGLLLEEPAKPELFLGCLHETSTETLPSGQVLAP